MKASRWIIVALLIVAVVCFFAFDLGEYLTLESIKAHSGALKAKVQDHPWWAAGVFFVVYAALTALSFPGTVVLTLLAGALFGLIEGTLLVSFASNAGALVAMLISRFMLRDWVQKRFGKQIAGINKGLTRDGTFYLVSLRLIPIVPFVLLNPALGLTRIKVWTFWWTTQLGMLPGNAIYVNAGEKLVAVRALSDILSPSIISTLVLLAVFPVIATRLLTYYKARKVYRGWRKPKRFDYNLVVIGGGAGGLATARIAATYKARVCLVERERLGGVAMHEGGVPTKAFRRLANELHTRHGGQPPVEAFGELMMQVRQLTESARHHASVDDCTRHGVEVVEGEARLSSRTAELALDGRGGRPHADHPGGRHCHWKPAVATADPRSGRSRAPDLRHAAAIARAARPPAHSRRRGRRLRVRPALSAHGFQGHRSQPRRAPA